MWGQSNEAHMKQGDRLFDFTKIAMNATNQNEIWDGLKSTLSSFGVKYVNYAFGKPDDLLMFSNMSAEWLTFYSENYGETDYLVQHCSSSSHTLHMDASHFNGEADIDQTDSRMMNEIREQGVRGGLCVPVSRPNSDYLAGVGIFFGLSERESRDVMVNHGEEISLIIHMMHQFMSDHELQTGDDIYATRNGQIINNSDILTNREKDVLRYLTIGLRPDRIAEKMGLQLGTIHMHIAKARRRLGAGTREQAIAMAISRRHIVL